MIKKDLVRYIQYKVNEGRSGQNKLSLRDIYSVYDVVSESILELVAEGEEVIFGDVGKFYRVIAESKSYQDVTTGLQKLSERKYIPKCVLSNKFKKMTREAEKPERLEVE